jgi:hypothetical protein
MYRDRKEAQDEFEFSALISPTEEEVAKEAKWVA